MSETVGQHGIAAFTNPSNGDALDATVVKGNDNSLRAVYIDHDSDPGIHVQSSLIASRPAAGTVGRKWLTTDSGSVRLWYDDGSTWREISYITPSYLATIASNIVPSAGNTFDVGLTGMRWRNAFLSGALSVTGATSTSGLTVSGADSSKIALVSGVTKGVRIGSDSTSSLVEGVDNTGIGSYQPLSVGGSELSFTTSNTQRMAISASGAVSIGGTLSVAGGLSSTNTTTLQQTLEKATISATAATGTINYDVLTQAVLYYTTNASGNWTLNLRGSSGASLTSIMTNGQALTVVFLVTNGTTAYYPTAHQIDGSSITPKWIGGTAVIAGNPSAIDVYTYTVIKAAAGFTLLASRSFFK